MPEISIVIPVYNVEKYLERCVKTVLNQTFKDLEIILVDDGSTDNSGILCEDIANSDTRVRVIHQKNGGISAARNIGIAEARGKYIGFVDSDDWIAVDMYEKLHNMLIQSGANIAECNFVKVDKLCDVLQPDKVEIREMADEDKMLALYSSESFGAIVVWNKLYDAKLFGNIQFLEGKWFEDQIITPQLFFEAKKVISTNYIGYYYFQRQESFTHTTFDLRKMEALEAYKRTRNFLVEKELVKILEHHDATYAFLLLKYIKLLKETHLDQKSVVKWEKEFDRLLVRFLVNSELNYKSKIILLVKRIFCIFV